MDYIEQIERAMKKHGLTKEKLAVRADLTSRTISRLKKGERAVVLETLDKVADALDMVVVIHLEPKQEAETTSVR